MNKINVNIDEKFSLESKFLEDLSHKKNTEIIIDFISDFKSAKPLRHFIGALCTKLNLKEIWKSRFILIADELNNNAIEYGSRLGDINRLRTYIQFNDDNIILKLEVSDTGKGQNPKTAKEMILLRNKKKLNGFYKNNGIRGRGLFMIIEKLVDKLYFKDAESGGLTVGIEKKFKIEK